MSRYNRRAIAVNSNELYIEQFAARDIVKVEQYRTPTLIFPTDEEEKSISFVSHPWSRGDKFYLLASRYYNDPKLWWIIAQYNKTPTEQHATEGQIIKIPFPLTAVYQFIGQE